jgi:hypothetical protein
MAATATGSYGCKRGFESRAIPASVIEKRMLRQTARPLPRPIGERPGTSVWADDRKGIAQVDKDAIVIFTTRARTHNVLTFGPINAPASAG